MDGKNLEIALLFDFYGEMLTDKQRDVIDLYYNEDLSLAEIAEHEGITRQGVRDNIKRGEAYLQELEDKLHFAESYGRLQELLDQLKELAVSIYSINEKYVYDNKIKQLSEEMHDLIVNYDKEQKGEES